MLNKRMQGTLPADSLVNMLLKQTVQLTAARPKRRVLKKSGAGTCRNTNPVEPSDSRRKSGSSRRAPTLGAVKVIDFGC